MQRDGGKGGRRGDAREELLHSRIVLVTVVLTLHFRISPPERLPLLWHAANISNVLVLVGNTRAISAVSLGREGDTECFCAAQDLPGRSDRVVKHSHHVSFALITKVLSHAFSHTRSHSLDHSRPRAYSHEHIHTHTLALSLFLSHRLKLNTIVDYKYVQLTSFLTAKVVTRPCTKLSGEPHIPSFWSISLPFHGHVYYACIHEQRRNEMKSFTTPGLVRILRWDSPEIFFVNGLETALRPFFRKGKNIDIFVVAAAAKWHARFISRVLC